MREGVLSRYEAFLPLTPQTPRICLGEGSTPLVRSRRLERTLGAEEVYFKLEGCNPTGSFKDRGMVVAVAKALEQKARAIMCASTGNTSASAAAYGAYAGLTTIVLVPQGNIARGKLAQAIAYGAQVIAIKGNFDRALELVRTLAQRYPITLVNSVNPYRLEGQKTAAFEIVDALGDAPDYLCIPVGNAGNITAYWKGFCEYVQAGRARRRPKMWGFQAEGAAPLVRGHPIKDPKTIASAIRIGNPASWQGALRARDESGGLIDTVTDEEILEAYKLLARQEGIFCEPASAAAVAGLLKQARLGADMTGKRVVCVLTGTGLKDPDLANQISDIPLHEVAADWEAVEAVVVGMLGR
ncbi:MAG: threonine synthase [Dehalococcoidia bacterium]|nr:threonine synthase [Dehalococcoidia bacterium]MDW8120060.1 threonine synthase [Chloroflexota bacterium]